LYRWHPWFGLRVSIHEAVDKADGVVFRCSLNGTDADRRLEVPAWMFDRSACARVRVAADVYVKLSALTSLMALLQHTLNDRFASSKAPLWGAPSLSHDQNRGEVHATTRRLIAWVAQSSMQLAQQVGDPLRHCFGNLASCAQFAGDSRLDFFDDQVLAR
jgi:hypothetical protein